MKPYQIMTLLLALGPLTMTRAYASSPRVDIDLDCISVINKDVAIRTGECDRNEKIAKDRGYREHPVHDKHPGKKKGHYKKVGKSRYKGKQ